MFMRSEPVTAIASCSHSVQKVFFRSELIDSSVLSLVSGARIIAMTSPANAIAENT